MKIVFREKYEYEATDETVIQAAESNGRVATKKGRGQDAAERDKEASENLLSLNPLSWPQGH